MPEPDETLKQWHPVLVDGLRHNFNDELRIEPEHAVAALPTRIDVLLLARRHGLDLPFPFNLLSPDTVLELEGPGEYATQQSLWKLYIDWGLYGLKEQRAQDAVTGLWLVASHMSTRFLETTRRRRNGLDQVGQGIWQGQYEESPLTLVHLHELPLTVDTLPLLMVYKGPREQEIVRFALRQGREHPFFVEQAETFHPKALQEVLRMEGMNVEAYRRLANVKDIIDLWTPRILIDEMGEEEAIRTIGEKQIARKIGRERMRQLLEELDQEAAEPEQDAG